MILRMIGIATAPALLALSAGTPALAQNAAAPAPAPPKPPACGTLEHRQFDFWIGDWDVHDAAGKFVGQNRITPMHQGCVLFENYRAGAFSGSSVNIYDAEHRKWHQTWVDSSGSLLLIEGGQVDGQMVLAGETADPAKAGGMLANRITWTALPDGRVRQHWETSADRGKTWTEAFDGYYTRQK